MLKVYIHPDQYNPLIPGVDLHILPFDIESRDFVITHSVEDCDVIPVMCDEPTAEVRQILGETCDKLVVRLIHTHIAEHDGCEYRSLYEKWKHYASKFCIAVTDINAEKNCPGVGVFYDFMWNRQKAYYIDYDQMIPGRIRMWSHLATKDMYQLTDIQPLSTGDGDIRKFLSPNRTDINYLGTSGRLIYRYLFYKYLHGSDAYWSDWSANPPNPLPAQQPGLMGVHGEGFAGWWPVNNYYYDNSIVSVYVETLVSETAVQTLTEKSFEPLLKGNFVLPFGYTGLIQDIKNYGFGLPDWIDYSYDTEPDETLRFALYVKEFLRLRNQYTLEQFVDFHDRDIEILLHNRSLFHTRPYHSLHDQLQQFISNYC